MSLVVSIACRIWFPTVAQQLTDITILMNVLDLVVSNPGTAVSTVVILAELKVLVEETGLQWGLILSQKSSWHAGVSVGCFHPEHIFLIFSKLT